MNFSINFKHALHIAAIGVAFGIVATSAYALTPSESGYFVDASTIGSSAPDSCRVWFDGCNTCSRTTPGGELMCTQMACKAKPPVEAYCKEYFSGIGEACPASECVPYGAPTGFSADSCVKRQRGQCVWYERSGDVPVDDIREIAVVVPGVFELSPKQTARVENYNDVTITLNRVMLDPQGGSAFISVGNRGGCSPEAEAKGCLGSPVSYTANLEVPIGGYIDTGGLRITFVSAKSMNGPAKFKIELQGNGVNDDDAPPDQICKVWFDGCNSCSRSAPGEPLRCTRMACIPEDTSEPYCREYFRDGVPIDDDGVAESEEPPHFWSGIGDNFLEFFTPKRKIDPSDDIDDSFKKKVNAYTFGFADFFRKFRAQKVDTEPKEFDDSISPTDPRPDPDAHDSRIPCEREVGLTCPRGQVDACLSGDARYHECIPEEQVDSYGGLTEPPRDTERECREEECGPALGMPAYACSDGSIGGNTGRCVARGNGKCGWEVRQCPENRVQSDEIKKSIQHYGPLLDSGTPSAYETKPSLNILRSIRCRMSAFWSGNSSAACY